MIDGRESYFNAATPGSVAFPAAPIIGMSSLSPFRYEHRDNHVIVFDVPLMDEHEDSSRRKPFNKFSGQLFDDVVRSTREFESKGAYVQIIIGHTEGEGDDEFSHPVVGHIRNVRTQGRIAGKRQIIGDMWFAPDAFEHQIKTNKYPRRSAEISRVDHRLDPVALLGASTPARPLPDMLFQKQGDACELYMAAHPNVGDEDMDPVLEAIKAMDEKFTKRFEAIEKFQDDSKPDDDDEAKKKEKEEADAAEKEKNKNKDGYDADGNKIEDDDKKDKSRSQADKETFAVLNNKVDTLSASVKALTDENATLCAERITDEIDAKVVYFKRTGVEMGDDKKVEQFKKSLAKLDAAERQTRYDEIEEHWSKVPVNVTIDRQGVIGDNTTPSEGPVDEAAKQTIIAMKYADKLGISMAEAAQIYQTQGEAGLESYKKQDGAALKIQY